MLALFPVAYGRLLLVSCCRDTPVGFEVARIKHLILCVVNEGGLSECKTKHETETAVSTRLEGPQVTFGSDCLEAFMGRALTEYLHYIIDITAICVRRQRVESQLGRVSCAHP